MKSEELSLAADVEKIQRMTVVPVILELICKVTGMGFAAVARVTPQQWLACQVRDEIKFGLLPGGELKVDTTICHEIRQSGEGVIIDNVDEDQFYCNHHTPLMYGFKSYISIPIKKDDGVFWGTLCAIDPRPALLNTPEIVGLFKTFAELISILVNKEELSKTQSTSPIEQGLANELNIQLRALIANASDVVVTVAAKRNSTLMETVNAATENARAMMATLRTIS